MKALVLALKTALKTALMAALMAGTADASIVFSEDFDNFANLTAQGWSFQNKSISAANPWFADTHNPPVPGLSDPFVSADFSSTGVTDPTGGNISNWMLTPQLSFDNGYVLQFYTSSVGDPPDRLEVRLSTNGASGDVGNTDTSVGDFTTLLLSINPSALWIVLAVVVNVGAVGVLRLESRLPASALMAAR